MAIDSFKKQKAQLFTENTVVNVYTEGYTHANNLLAGHAYAQQDNELEAAKLMNYISCGHYMLGIQDMWYSYNSPIHSMNTATKNLLQQLQANFHNIPSGEKVPFSLWTAKEMKNHVM